jgi:hypothetical protein
MIDIVTDMISSYSFAVRRKYEITERNFDTLVTIKYCDEKDRMFCSRCFIFSTRKEAEDAILMAKLST